MKRIIVLLLCLLCVGCQFNDASIDSFQGKWKCLESPLQHSDYYSGYLCLNVEDEQFTIYDQEAGNPGIMGEITILSTDELKLICNLDEDFDPPVTWQDMSDQQIIKYEFKSNNELHLTFENNNYCSTLVFIKE